MNSHWIIPFIIIGGALSLYRPILFRKGQLWSGQALSSTC